MTPPASVRIMGILNVTPDSFSDGGSFHSLSLAVDQAARLIDDGADILDIGGESSRPFAEPVSEDEELERVIPVIEAIRRRWPTPISIDTTKAAVARTALAAGADIINDISALRKDPRMLEVVQESTVPLIIMHMQGTPADMQIKPEYQDVVADVIAFFQERIAWLRENGVAQDRLIIDPGIGFGKTMQHNLSILKHLKELTSLKVPVLLGHSRKRFLGELSGLAVQDRDNLTAVISALSVREGIAIVRVHNVAASRLAIQVTEAIAQAV
ncbi:MAG: dihydropteroate synthase [Desulfoprunum sp.]|nr:dihydropteroate synthase [Desulfoprunum sp.]